MRSSSGGNLVISTSGSGTHVVAVTDTTVTSSTSQQPGGQRHDHRRIGRRAGDHRRLDRLGSAVGQPRLAATTWSSANPNVSSVADAAITDFVANHPGVFFDPTNPSSAGLDINDLVAEILDLSDPSSFDATKATFTTKDTATGGGSVIDISLANVELSLSVTMGSAAYDYLEINADEGRHHRDRDPRKRRWRHGHHRRCGRTCRPATPAMARRRPR